jgi:hypothetical protein
MDMFGSPRMGDLNNWKGGAYHWGSQVLYKENITRKEFSSRSELRQISQFP